MVFKGYLCSCFIILYFQAALLKLFIKLVCFTVCQCADSTWVMSQLTSHAVQITRDAGLNAGRLRIRPRERLSYCKL